MEQQKLLSDGTPAPEIEVELPPSEPVAPTKKLRLVESETGEFTERECPGCRERDAEIEKLTTDARSWHRRFLNAKADEEAKARRHELWPKAVKLFEFWKERTNHKRSEWTAARFELCLSYLQKDAEAGTRLCERAIEGIAYDPNTKVMRNGAVERFDSWELLFRNRATFERYVNRAPYHLPDPDKVKTVANALAFLYPNMPLAECVEKAKRVVR